MVAASSSTIHTLYDAARTAAVVFDRGDRGRLLVTGKDRAGFLHALFSNDITALTAGRGCYTTYLTPQGRMITDFTVHELGDRIWLELDRSLAASMAMRLDQLIFAEDVHVSDVTDVTTSVLLVGPEAPATASALVQGVTLDDLRGVADYGSISGTFEGRPATILRSGDLGTDGYEVVVDVQARSALDGRLSERGVARGSEELAEVLRVEGGVPKFLRDMTTETIPLEAGIEDRAISMTKGCYVGQEVIVRVLHRGHGRVAEKLVGLTIEGPLPVSGSPITSDGKVVGRVTSSVISIALGKPIALGYVDRDFVRAGTRVATGSGTAIVRETLGIGDQRSEATPRPLTEP